LDADVAGLLLDELEQATPASATVTAAAVLTLRTTSLLRRERGCDTMRPVSMAEEPKWMRKLLLPIVLGRGPATSMVSDSLKARNGATTVVSLW